MPLRKCFRGACRGADEGWIHMRGEWNSICYQVDLAHSWKLNCCCIFSILCSVVGCTLLSFVHCSGCVVLLYAVFPPALNFHLGVRVADDACL